MATFTVDGVTIDIQDTSTLSLIKSSLEKRDNQINSLTKELARFDGKKFKVGDQEKEYTDMSDLYNDMMKMVDAMKKDMASAKGKCDALDAELAKRNDSTNLLSLVKERRQLERLASPHLDGISDNKLDDLTNRQLKEEVIKSHWEFTDLSSREDAEINGMFAVAIKDLDNKKQSFENQKNLIATSQSTNNDDQDIYGLQSYLETVSNAWRLK